MFLERYFSKKEVGSFQAEKVNLTRFNTSKLRIMAIPNFGGVQMKLESVALHNKLEINGFSDSILTD